ncbi:hypothetical protein CJF43_14370 [Pseudomonas fragi]|uniref:Uncharacterized protein n=1 Tax=Pseudomonas fragi TaxID=296 RepID=A0A266LUW9_PSEFR|nr:hypothetical protein [Pseudomonas fragi]OZY41075.1 hypothetical protein CJF43_14370 [Pseudomonas fragi]
MSETKLVRGRQAKPTKSEVASAWEHIRAAAETGDLQACALLIALSENKPLHLDSGILNLLGHGGWVGDKNDPGEHIRATIRANDPQSKQLPENQ